MLLQIKNVNVSEEILFFITKAIFFYCNKWENKDKKKINARYGDLKYKEVILYPLWWKGLEKKLEILMSSVSFIYKKAGIKEFQQL